MVKIFFNVKYLKKTWYVISIAVFRLQWQIDKKSHIVLYRMVPFSVTLNYV